MNYRFHREGRPTLVLTAVTFGFLIGMSAWLLPFLVWPLLMVYLVLLVFFLQFFRNPQRQLPRQDDRLVYAPADGKVVAIEEIYEPEYLQEKCLQISIFMSVWDVHANRYPVGGRLSFFRYHPGKYLVARHPKSSTENERTTVVVDTGKEEILCRQIAGFMARRIVFYQQEGEEVKQGQEMGFIKFGSRVDIFLPLEAKVQVEIGRQVYGKQDVLARLP